MAGLAIVGYIPGSKQLSLIILLCSESFQYSVVLYIFGKKIAYAIVNLYFFLLAGLGVNNYLYIIPFLHIDE